MAQNRINSIVLMSLTAVAVILCFMIFRPFMKPIVSAVVLVIIFYPLHLRIVKLLPYPNIAALLSTLLVVILIAVPVFGLGGILGSELKGVYGLLTNPKSSQGGQSAVWSSSLQRLLQWFNFVGISGVRFDTLFRGPLEGVTGYCLGLLAGTFRNMASLFAKALTSFFVLFFLFRDGPGIKRTLTLLLPSAEDRLERLFEHINETVLATVYGSLAIASVQGALTGVAFWVLGFRSPVLWGALTAVFALVPVVGTGFVWIPAAVILVSSGHVGKAVALVVWCSLVVHPVDNVAKPYLISGRIKELSTLYLFLALLGGLEAFGFLGLFMGPVVLSLTWALFKMLREQFNTLPGSGQPGGLSAFGADHASPPGAKMPTKLEAER